MASSKKPVTASKSKSPKSGSAASAKAKTESKAPAKTAGKAKTAVTKPAMAKAAAKAPAKTEKAKAPEKAKAAAKPAEKTTAKASKTVAKAPAKCETKPRAAAKAAVAPAKLTAKAAPKAPAKPAAKDAPKAKAPAPAPAKAAEHKPATKPAAAKVEKAPVKAAKPAAKPAPAPEKAAVKTAPAPEKAASKKPVQAAVAEKIPVTPERTPAAGVGVKKEAGKARKEGGKIVSKAAVAAAPVQPVTRLAPARLAMGSSAGPAAQNIATKDDAVKSPQTTNAGKAQAAAPATGAPAKAAEKPAAKPGAHRTGFKVNEFIVYPAHGVGQIIAIEEQEVAGFKLELFVINFIKDKMTLKVPLPKVTAGAIRKLADTDTVQKALDTLTGRARVKRTMWSRRAQEYEAKINSGDLQAIAEVVRDLYRSDAQPEQSYSERQLYEAALDRMAREIAAVNKLTETESLKLIESQLQNGPRHGAKADAETAEEDIDEEAEDGDVEEAA